ncbi:nucleotidyltransferase family protein [Clostridium neonatale]|uniref:nucleotidyltransferase family protein n=1 Tax=Clostridium neonatale TaxID=137838 RepID=UPI003D32904A
MRILHEDIFINKECSIRDAIKRLDVTAKKILFVVNEGILIGSITDGDIRRLILRNGNLNDNVTKVMNQNPIYIYENDKNLALDVMKEKVIESIPVVNEKREILDVIFFKDISSNMQIHKPLDLCIPVVIMAGGKGTRLYPYTKILPKPLIPIGEYSITERIINKFLQYGCREFYMTVNYKKNMIKAYFDELNKDYRISYVEEEKFLGTGGALYLLKEKLQSTFFVSNCDILIDADYSKILDYHKKNENLITMVTSLKNYVIPYGVIELNNEGNIKEMKEKPEYDYLVNTGAYILEPEVLNDIPENEFFHITDLINKYIKNGKKVGTYPITENAWLDMGEFKEMERMRKELNID